MSEKMDDQQKEQEALERILIDESAEPIMLSYAFIRKITNDFSQEIGRGGFGVVYMGFLQNGNVAVKKLSKIDHFCEKQFEDELKCLTRVKHKNIVRFLGYCSDTQQKVEQYDGQIVLADIRRRFLCFKYVTNKSLHNYLKDESHGREWETRYQLIEGICQGLHYLHIEERIIHLDLKPENILLDADMTPKITDFGLSRRFSGEQSRIITEHIRGTLGYIAPEYLCKGEISFKTDIYSLGVVIKKILRGSNDLSDFENWHESQDIDIPQIKRCIKIAQFCVDDDQHKRPTVDCIIDWLNEKEIAIEMVSPVSNHSRSNSGSALEHVRTDSVQLLGINPEKVDSATEASNFVSSLVDQVQSMAVSAVISSLERKISVPKEPEETRSTEIHSRSSCETGKLLDIHPQELHFTFEPNMYIECPVNLTNTTDHFIGVWIRPTSPDTCFRFPFPLFLEKSWEDRPSYIFQIMKPHYTRVVVITMKEQRRPPQDMYKFKVLMIVMGSEHNLQILKSSIDRSKLNTDNSFFLKRVEELGGEVHRDMLTAVICGPANDHKVVTRQIISTTEFGAISSMDVHPTEKWILAGHGRGFVSIWDYQMQERVMELQVSKKSGMLYFFTNSSFTSCSVYSVKFISREEWFATGDGEGYIHIYNYSTMDKVKEFQAHRHKVVDSLAVHHTHAFLLSSSSSDMSIKLWDWDQGWVCTRTFDGHSLGVTCLTFNPRDVNTFASVSDDRTTKVWNIHSSQPITTVEGSDSADYLYTDSHQHFLVTCGGASCAAHIRDLQTEKRVHSLGMSGRYTLEVACHPTLPILVTRSGGGIVCLWDASTYRLEKMVHLTDREVQDLELIGTMDLKS
ncbi:hypothetical protein ACP70R_021514 [Stipagrostis hirtigluma subsp. patula]